MTTPKKVTISRELYEFLLGAEQIDGVGFGERHPVERGAYWWRKRLREEALDFPMSLFQTGDQVEKFTGDYVAPREVRAVFTTKAGKVRYSVEHTWPGGSGGFLHIYSESNLRPAKDHSP